MSVAPYQIHLLGLDLAKAEIRQCAEGLYAALGAAGLAVLYDDRPGSAGVKFNDADLLGLPVRTVVSKRSYSSGGCEIKRRKTGVSRIVLLEDAVPTMQEEVRQALAERG